MYAETIFYEIILHYAHHSKWPFHTCSLFYPRNWHYYGYTEKKKNLFDFCATVWCESLFKQFTSCEHMHGIVRSIWARSTMKATSCGWSFMVNNQVFNLHRHFTYLSSMYRKQFLKSPWCLEWSTRAAHTQTCPWYSLNSVPKDFAVHTWKQ